jgi:hypothetical protein
MSSTIEDRLAAALEARAELVTPEDLGPIEVPGRPRLRRGAVLLLAAAATAAVVAVPFVLGDFGTSDTQPTHKPSLGVPSQTPSGQPTDEPTDRPSDVEVEARLQADVDGDGRPDDVRVLFGGGPDEVAAGSVEVTLATGVTSSAPVPDAYAPDVLRPYDMNGDGHDQVLLKHTAGGDTEPLLVYSWDDGRLVQLKQDPRPPLALGLDGEGRTADYYRDGGLISWERLRPVDPGGGPLFHVRQWLWLVTGDRLSPVPRGQACVDATTSEPPGPCP